MKLIKFGESLGSESSPMIFTHPMYLRAAAKYAFEALHAWLSEKSPASNSI